MPRSPLTRTRTPRRAVKTPLTETPDKIGPVEDVLTARQGQDLLRFITCGSVDDGKSTLMGRLLWDARQLLEDQVAALRAESRKHGTQGQDIDFALLVDGLSAEREQGITIDVAYRFFATARRRFIVADTPGHEQYTRNMVTGASTADMAIVLVDARAGLLKQTRRHAFLVSLMGIRHVALAINKMDLVDFSADRFHEIRTAFEGFASGLGFESITAIALSALKGDNVTERSVHTPWYQGPTLMACLESVPVHRAPGERLVFPVQWVNRPHADFRGLSGTVAEGSVRVGDEIRVSASGQLAVVADIVTMDGSLASARAGDAVTLCLDQDIDASRGDVLSLSRLPLDMTDQFEATVVWMHLDEGLPGRQYDLKLAHQWTPVSITEIKHRVDVDNLSHQACRSLQLNDIAVCNLATTRGLVFDSFANSTTLGSFILVDRFTQATVAAGMVRHGLRRAQNVHRQALSVTRVDRERLNGHKGQVIWFTGLSGSGKSTLANALALELHARGVRTFVLDGDNVRQALNRDLGFSPADRVENIRRVAEVARLLMDAGLVVLTAFISPFRQERALARELIGAADFTEVHVSTPLAVCEQRDVKGLYKLARTGQIPNMTGINSPYEAPESPDSVADTSVESLDAVVQRLAAGLLGPQKMIFN